MKSVGNGVGDLWLRIMAQGPQERMKSVLSLPHLKGSVFEGAAAGILCELFQVCECEVMLHSGQDL